MAPAYQEDGGQPAGPSSFVNRVRTNLEKLTKTRVSKHHDHKQDELRNGITELLTTTPGLTSLEPPQATRPLNIPLPRLHRLRIPPYKRWSGSSEETWFHVDRSRDSSPTTLVGSPDSWSWKSNSEWSLVPSPTPKEDLSPTAPSNPIERHNEHEERHAEACNHLGRGPNHPDVAPLDASSVRPSSPVLPPPCPPPRRRISHHSALAQRAWPSRLPTDVWHLVAERLDQHDLAQLAAACRDTRYVTDRFLYRNPTVRSAQSMARWVGALATQPHRRRLVRSLTIGWDATGVVEGEADEAYVQMTRTLRGSCYLKTMTLFANAPEGRFATKRALPHSVRTLNASGAVFLNLHQPLCPLLHLSVNVSIKDLKKTLSAIGCFGETLLQLRLFVKWETPFVKTEDNPARWCKPLKTPRLVYFELREERSEKDVPLRIASGRWDKVPVESTWPVVLAERVPNLQYLMWQPLWNKNEHDVLPGGGFYDVVRGYRDNLFALLKLDVLAFALPDGRYSCHESGKENPRDGRPLAGPEDLWRSMRKGDRDMRLL